MAQLQNWVYLKIIRTNALSECMRIDKGRNIYFVLLCNEDLPMGIKIKSMDSEKFLINF